MAHDTHPPAGAKTSRRRVGRAEPDPVDVHVGMRIRFLRGVKKVSQEALAEALGLSFQQVQKYEWGTNRISASKMLAVCRRLGCQPNDLFEGLPLPDQAPETPDQAAARLALQDRDTVSLLAAFRACADGDQLVLRALAKRLAGR